jgi:predicted deacylase
MAPIHGLFEPSSLLGDDIEAGQVVGLIWPMDDMARAPVPVHHAAAGRILCIRTMPMVRRGDFLLHTGAMIDDAQFLET